MARDNIEHDFIFQSTLPVRGATQSRWYTGPAGRNFNPSSPCGERPGGAGADVVKPFSIHAPREWSDAQGGIRGRSGMDFNPRSP